MEGSIIVEACYEGPNGQDAMKITADLKSCSADTPIDTLLAGLNQVQKRVNEHLYKVASLPLPPGGESSSSDDEIRFDQSEEEEGNTTLNLTSQLLDEVSEEGAESQTKKPRLSQ